MEATKQVVKYPENLHLVEVIKESGQSVKHVAKTIGFSRKIVSETIHGHYKGSNVVPLIKKHFNLA